MTFIIIKITCPNLDEARKVSTILLQEKLISSANFFPIKSISSWTGKIEEVNEAIVFLKTKKSKWEKVRDKIIEIHPYPEKALCDGYQSLFLEQFKDLMVQIKSVAEAVGRDV